MTKKIFKIALTLAVALIAMYALYLYMGRSYYSLGEDKTITVWKKVGNVCYVIPGKYYGILAPRDNYIKLDNIGDITFYWSEEVKDEIIFRTKSNYFIKNTGKLRMSNYDDSIKSSELRELLYGNGEKKFKEVKSNVHYIAINIKENYARDKNGRKL